MKVSLAFPGCHRKGGVERVMLECANFLQARGHETHVYASDWDLTSLRADVARHQISVPNRPSLVRLLRFIRTLRTEMGQERISPSDVVGGYGILTPPGAVIWAQSVHGAWLEISRRQRSPSGRLKQRLNLNHPVIIAMEKKYFGGRQYKKMIALSSQVKADLMRLYQVPDEDIVIIPNGFAPGEFNVAKTSANRSAARTALGYGEQAKVVIFVANELERKGFGPLLRSIARIDNKQIHLLAVGRLNPSTYAPEIERLGLTGRVRFTGPTADVAGYYAAADVFALPTQYEAWGLVIVEAMACGLPVLTSQLAGAAITVREGENGYLLNDPSSVNEIQGKLDQLLGWDIANRRDAISQSVESYGWPHVLLEYEKVLADTVTANPRVVMANQARIP